MTTNLGDHAGVNLNGLDNARSIVFDYTHHRMFVVDNDNSRVLIYNLNNSDQLLDNIPDFVLGQADFVTTNGQGNGTSNVMVSHATLMSAPFGVGDQKNHIDLRKDVNDTSTGLYTVTGVDYTVEP